MSLILPRRRLILAAPFISPGVARAFLLRGASSYYNGPGDIIPGAALACMLRGYSSRTANTPQAINVRRSTDNDQIDIGLIHGRPDQATAASFAGASWIGTASISGLTLNAGGGAIGYSVAGAGVLLGTVIVGGSSGNWTVSTPGITSQTVTNATITLTPGLYATTLYDQSGGGNHAYQATDSAQLQLFLYGPNGLPYLSANIAAGPPTGAQGGSYGSQYLITATSPELGSAYTMAFYIQPIGLGASGNILTAVNAGVYGHGNPASGGMIINSVAGSYDNTLSSGFILTSPRSWYSMQTIFNGANSAQYIGQTKTASGPIDVTDSNTQIGIVAEAVSNVGNEAEPAVINGTEFEIWPSAPTDAQSMALAADQKNFWGT